jgi:hypothetical protein
VTAETTPPLNRSIYMRKITKALIIGTVIAAVGGIGLGAMAEPSGPGYGPPCIDGMA